MNPQFIATHAGVTNDPLLNAIFSLALLGMVQRMESDATWRSWAALGAGIGLGLLTKQSAALLLPLGGLAIVLQTRRVPRTWAAAQSLLVNGLAFGGAALLVGGWWYARNALLYSDLLGTAPHYAAQVALTRFDGAALLNTFRSYWLNLGWGLLLAPNEFYSSIAGVLAIAALGWARAFWRKEVAIHRAGFLLLAAFLLNAVAFRQWAVMTGAPYGRLLFPTVAVMAVGVVGGWAQWPGRRILRLLGGVVLSGALLFALTVPWTILRPAFASPHTEAAPPAAAVPLEATFARQVLLRGYTAPTADLRPGDTLPVTPIGKA